MQKPVAGIKSYLIVNLVLAGLIGLIFIYSRAYSAAGDKHPVPSFFEEITGKEPPSAGMSRAFSEIVRGNLDAASAYNPDSLLIFAFFLIQGIQRLAVSFILVKGKRSYRKPVARNQRTPMKYLLPADVLTSLILFIYCFMGQIRAMVSILQDQNQF